SVYRDRPAPASSRPGRREKGIRHPAASYPLLLTYAVRTRAPLQVALSLRAPVSQAAVVAGARARGSGACSVAGAAEPVRARPGSRRAGAGPCAGGSAHRSPVQSVRQQGGGHARGPEEWLAAVLRVSVPGG